MDLWKNSIAGLEILICKGFKTEVQTQHCDIGITRAHSTTDSSARASSNDSPTTNVYRDLGH
jgi:hypothetical protein